MENTLTKLATNAEYKEVVSLAKQLGITYAGVKKPQVIEMVNAKIDEINAGGGVAVTEQTETSTNEEANPTNEDQTNETPQAATPSPAKAAAEQAAKRQQREPRQARVASKKWYEEPGAVIYGEGDVVEITEMEKHKGLIGRKAQVQKPSAKKDAVKAILIHPVTGQLQNSLITLTYDQIKLVSKAGQEEAPVQDQTEETQTPTNEATEAPVVETPVNEETPVATETEEANNEESTLEEPIKAEHEEVDLPNMDSQEEEEEKKAE